MSLTAHSWPGCCTIPSWSGGPVPFCLRLRDRIKKKAAAKMRSAPSPNPTASPAINPVCELSLLLPECALARGVPVTLAAAFAAGAVVDDASAVFDVREVLVVVCRFGVSEKL